jgi:hypothetical protein
MGAEEVLWSAYHPRYVMRDTAARSEWRDVVKRAGRAADDMFAIDVIRKGLRHGDEIV